MPRVSPDQIGNRFAPFPSLPEQRAIAAFLDCETAGIDALVAKNERMIVLLQEEWVTQIGRSITLGLDPDVTMNDSGVVWLGQVPEHWEVKRPKYAATLSTSPTETRNFDASAAGGAEFL